MDRRALKFMLKRTDIKSDTTTAVTNNSYLPTQPLKDNSNIRIIKSFQTEQTHQAENTTASNHKQQQPTQTKSNERPLKCLETLAQKAGITFDEKYDFASPPHPGISGSSQHSASTSVSVTTSYTNTLGAQKQFIHKMEKSQSPGQQVATSAVPLQISPEQLQQLQHLQLQHGSPFGTIQVKQEFPTHQLGGTGGPTDLKHTGILDQTQLQQMQMQLDNGAPGSPVSQHTPNSAATAMQQHSTTISTMSPMQLTTAGQVPGDWSQGRTVQLMQPPTASLNSGFLYHPQMLVSGNLIHSTGLGQQPIQVIAAGKPFQSGAPQMITATQNTKQMLGGNSGFPSGTYATLPTIPSSQSPQTLLFSPVNVISQTQQQQQQNILQTMAAAAAQQQQQQNKVNHETQKNLQQKVVQKVTTTTNTVQSATGPGGVAAVGQQQQQQSTQQCVQVSQAAMPTTQILQGTAGGPQQMQISAPWVQSVPFWAANGIQQLTQNPIIIRGTQADGTQGMFIQQPTTHQTLQTQQPNQITLQCNVTQTPTKSKQQTQQQQTQQQQVTPQQHTVVAAAPQLQQHQQQRSQQLMPQNGTQIRPASSVSTQTAQNQSLLKHKIRNKQQPVRPALPAMKTEIGQQHSKPVTATTTAGLHQQLAAIAQQQQTPTMHQVVTSAGNKMVVMSAGTPITIQNGQSIQQASANHVEKQQQQIQLQHIKQQQQQQVLLQQQLLQQQLAQIQLQQQQQQSQQIHLQMAPQSYITQQQQHQLQNHIMQQHQHQHQQNNQQHHQQQLQQQQRELQQQQPNTGIIHQIVVQQSPQQQHLQQQITAVPFSVSSSTPSSIATSNSSLQQQHIAYQSKTTAMPTTSVVTISNQVGPVVTSTVGINQVAHLQQQQNILASTMAVSQSQQHQQQIGPPSTPIVQTQQPLQPSITSLPSQNPIHAMASMTNAAISGGNTTPNTLLSPMISSVSSLPSTPTKPVAVEQQRKIVSPSTSTSVATKESKPHTTPTCTETSTETFTKPTEINTSASQQPAESSTNTSSTTQIMVESTLHTDISTTLVSPIKSNSEASQASRPPSPTNTTTNKSSIVSALQDDSKKLTNPESKATLASSTHDEGASIKTTIAASQKSTPSTTTAKTEKDLPKAMIKPNVLTHVIDGFIIQEANEPFPVTRQRYADKDSVDEPPKKKKALDDSNSSSLSNSLIPPDMVPCENCGKNEHKTKLKKKRFCSLTCARQAKASIGEQNASEVVCNDGVINSNLNIVEKDNALKLNLAETTVSNSYSEKIQTDTPVVSNVSTITQHPCNVVPQSSLSSISTTQEATAIEAPSMVNWTVSDVCDFIKNLPGCSDYVEDFEQQEIDGQALLLLKENHLVNAMGMKLGPALKIVAKVESMKEAATVTAANANATLEKEYND